MKRWVLTALGGLSFACSFDAPSSGPNADIEETDTGDMSTGDDPPLPGSTSGSAGGSGDTGLGSSTTAGPADSSDPTGTTTGPASMPAAKLVFVEAGPVDLGTMPLGAGVREFELTNEGNAAASVLGGEPLPPPLIWAGGEFPGLDEGCGGLIPPGGTCSVAIAASSGMPGYVAGAVEVRYDDKSHADVARLEFSSALTGSGPNLVVNPRAEDDPQGAIQTGWQLTSGDFHTNGEENHGRGSLSFFAGDASESGLVQDIDVAPLMGNFEPLPVRFVLRGWSKARSPDNDPHDIRLLFFDGSSTVLGAADRSNMDHQGWEQTVLDREVPDGTRRIRVELFCDRHWFDACSAWFDDFDGRFVYEP